MFHHGQLPEHAYTDEFVEIGKPRRRLNKPKFYEYLKGGATLQINWLERPEDAVFVDGNDGSHHSPDWVDASRCASLIILSTSLIAAFASLTKICGFNS